MQKNEKQNGQQNGKHGDQQDKSLRKFLLAGPTEFAAMQDGAAYVNSIAGRVDLVGASVWLLGSTDEKIAKAELDRLRDMKFGKGPMTVIEEVPRVETGDMPRPVR
jgi:ABC-type phosphate transport system substrate-binding protein